MTALDPGMAVPADAARRRTAAPQKDGMRSATATRYDRVQLILGLVAFVAGLALVIVGALNRSLQADVVAGQARIANAQAAANVNNTLIRLLAKAAAERNDEQIRTLLSQNGISFRQTGPNSTTGAADAGAATPLPPK